MLRNFSVLLIALAGVFSGCVSDAGDVPHAATFEYSVVCTGGARPELPANTYDIGRPCYWISGATGTLQIERLSPAAGAPRSPMVLILRTTPGDAERSQIAFLRIVTPAEDVVTMRAGEDSIAFMKLGRAENVAVKNGTDFIKIEREKARVKITLSPAFLREYLPASGVLSWFQNVP